MLDAFLFRAIAGHGAGMTNPFLAGSGSMGGTILETTIHGRSCSETDPARRRKFYATLARHNSGRLSSSTNSISSTGQNLSLLGWSFALGLFGRAGATQRGLRRSQSSAPRPQFGQLPRDEWPQAANDRPAILPVRARVWHGNLHATQERSRAPLNARDFRADLRNLQDLPGHAGQVHPCAVGLHRGHHHRLLRMVGAGTGQAHRCHAAHHSSLQPDWNCRQLRSGLVRHSRQHVCELAHGVCRARRQALSDLCHPAQGRHEYRHDADQRGIADHALHPAVHPGRLRGPVLHRVRHRRIAGRGRSPYRGRHFHQDRRHRLRPDEDRLQD